MLDQQFRMGFSASKHMLKLVRTNEVLDAGNQPLPFGSGEDPLVERSRFGGFGDHPGFSYDPVKAKAVDTSRVRQRTDGMDPS